MKTFKDHSLKNLLSTLSQIKGEDVSNTSELVYTNLKIPSLKYYNINNNLRVFDLDDHMKSIGNLTIVGTYVVSRSRGNYGTENAWGGKLMVVDVMEASEYIEHFTMQHSKSMTFYDNAYPTKEALERIEANAKKTFETITKSYKKKYGAPDRRTGATTLEELGYKLQDGDIQTEKSIPEHLDYKTGKEPREGKTIISARVFGEDNLETREAIDLVANMVEKTYKAKAIGMNRTEIAGQDWNGRIWGSGGVFTLYFA